MLKAGDPDDIPDSFCCPITHVSQLQPCAGIMHEIHHMCSDECMPMDGHLESCASCVQPDMLHYNGLCMVDILEETGMPGR